MNVYLAVFTGGIGRPDKYATILAADFDTAAGYTLMLRNKFVPGHSCSTSVLADERDVNPPSADVADMTPDQYLGIFTVEKHPPRMEVVLETPHGNFNPSDQRFIRQQLSGYNIVSIRELE